MRSSPVAISMLLACSSPAVAPPPAAPTASPTPAVTDQPKSCDLDPDITAHALPALACARDAMARSELDTADHLAEVVMTKFPYSKAGLQAEVLRIDILVARHDYAEAAEAYDRYLKFHPTDEHADEIRQKQADAAARAKQP